MRKPTAKLHVENDQILLLRPGDGQANEKRSTHSAATPMCDVDDMLEQSTRGKVRSRGTRILLAPKHTAASLAFHLLAVRTRELF